MRCPHFHSLVSVFLMLTLLGVVAGCDQMSSPTAPEVSNRSSDVPREGVSTAANQYIIVLDDRFAPGGHAANRAQAADIARELGVTPQRTFGTVLFGFAAVVPEDRLGAVRSDRRVTYVHEDRPVSIPTPQARATALPCSVTGTCDEGGQTLPWGVDRIDAEKNSNTGSGIHVYVLDTGIDSDHADLQANLGNGYAVENCLGTGCHEDWDDDHDHGTHVAGSAGAIDNSIDVIGTAPDVTLHAVKVLNKLGLGSWSGIIEGIDWVAHEVDSRGEAAVANMSLGGSGSKKNGNSCDDSGFTGSDDAMHEAICNAANVGVVFSVAAGNDGADAENTVPAAYDDAVITASATSGDADGNNNDDDWPSWSNWGDNAADWDNDSGRHAPVAIGAPGAQILSTKRGGGTTTMSGTSMAAPHTAGATALYLKSNVQVADYSAFSNTRSGLISADESTDDWDNTSGNRHDEDFVDAEGL